MSHYNRRYLQMHNKKVQPFDIPPPLINKQARLKQIYEGHTVFKESQRQTMFKKSQNRHYVPLTSRKNQEISKEIRQKSHTRNIQLGEVKVSNRYKEIEKQQKGQSFSLYQSRQNEKTKVRNIREQMPLTTRNKDEAMSMEKNQLFKIKRKSISGNLKKKMKEMEIHHLSSVNPTVPIEINYFQEGKRAYKQAKISQALKLFDLSISKNPQFAQGYYYSSLCYLNKHNYRKSFEALNYIIERFPTFQKKTVYLFASISAKHMDETGKAMSFLAQGISKYPDFMDLYLYRARLNEGQNCYEDALEDYETVLKTKKNNPQVLLNYAICLKKLNHISKALSALNTALYNDKTGQTKSKILLQRIKINFELQKIQDSKKDIVKLEEMECQNCQLSYFKGLLHLKQKNKNQALLSFQKCIRINTEKQAVAGSLIQITKSKIEDRDFYSALYHINRSKFLQITTVQIQKFKLFTEGVVFLMKRKINEGVDNFQRLAKQYSPIGPYFEKLFYLYQAFGHFMQSRHGLAIADYETSEKFTPKDKSVRYNQLIAEGIVFIHEQQFQKALQKFDQAQKTISLNQPTEKIQPYIYRAMTFVQKIKSSSRKQKTQTVALPLPQNELQSLQDIFIALKELDKAYDVNDSNSNMLYLRSLIYMYLGKCDDALQDIIKAISKSQENVAKYFFYRAMAQETLKNTKQAFNDFNICINLDEKYVNAYIERAKLFFASGQPAKGLQDLKKIKEISPQTDTKLIQCNLLYLYKQYDAAQICYNEIQTLEKKQKLQILINLKQLRVTNAKELMTSKGDKMICDIILGRWSTDDAFPDDLEYFTRVDYYNYLGIKYYHLGSYQEALNNFILGAKEKSLLDLEDNMNGNQEEKEENQEQAQFVLESQTKDNQGNYLNYNTFISYLALKEYKKAYEIFVRDILPAKQYFLRSDQVSLLSKILFQSMKVKEQENILKQTIQIVLFRSLFGESVDFIEINLPNCIFRTKLCYLMPFAKDIERQYSARVNPDFMLRCLKISEVENRPQPPWVKRNNQDLVFTDDIIDINVQFQTTEHDEEEQNEEDFEPDDNQEAEDQEMGTQREEEASREEVVFDPRRFRDQIKLDDDIELKLQKLIQRKKKTQL